MRIKLGELKRIIRDVITETAITDTAVSKNIGKKLDSNQALTQAVQQVQNSKDLAAVINHMITTATAENQEVDRSDVLKALSGVTSATKNPTKNQEPTN